MSLQEHEIELMDGFLRGELDETNRMTFNKLLETNPTFKKEYEQRASLQKIMAKNSNLRIKQILQNKEQTKFGRPDPKVFPIVRYIRIAASLLILAGILSFFIKPSSDAAFSKLYAENFTAYPNDYQEVERGEAEETAAKEILANYSNKDYSKVISGIDTYLNSTNLQDDKLLFFKAMALMGLDKHDEAKDLLNTLENSNNLKTYYNQIAWYSALNYLALQDPNNAKIELSKLLNSTDDFRKTSAKELLAELDK